MDALFNRAEAIFTKNEGQELADFATIRQGLFANNYPPRFIDNRQAQIEERKARELPSHRREAEGQLQENWQQ